MKILFLGFSRIVQKRVLPATKRLPAIEAFDVATRRAGAAANSGAARVFNDYGEALAESDAALVYVSTVNADHARWVRAALERGRHVVVDKPAVIDVDEARVIVELARAAKLLVAESVVYACHPQVAAAREVFDRLGAPPTRLAATFSFPPLDPANFRYRRREGGGAIYDLGPYAVSLGRIFFDAPPERIEAQVHSRADEVETSFSVLATYSRGRCVVGHFGFDTEYCNRLLLLGQRGSVELDRVFTPPLDLSMELTVRTSNQTERRIVTAADPFALFLADVVESISRGATEPFAANLLADAEALARLRCATEALP